MRPLRESMPGLRRSRKNEAEHLSAPIPGRPRTGYQNADPVVSSYDFPFCGEGSAYDYTLAAYESGRVAGPEFFPVPEAFPLVRGYHSRASIGPTGVPVSRNRCSAAERGPDGDVDCLALGCPVPVSGGGGGLAGCYGGRGFEGSSRRAYRCFPSFRGHQGTNLETDKDHDWSGSRDFCWVCIPDHSRNYSWPDVGTRDSGGCRGGNRAGDFGSAQRRSHQGQPRANFCCLLSVWGSVLHRLLVV